MHIHFQQLTTLIFLICAGLFSVNALSDKLIIYKCTDPSGVVHFEMSPPKNCVTVEKIVKKQKKVDPTTASSKTSNADKRKEAEKEKAAQEAEKKVTEENEKSNAELCKKARQNLEILSNQRFVSKINEQGEKIALTEEQRLSAKKNAQDVVDKYCK